jgi:hypothetical protein
MMAALPEKDQRAVIRLISSLVSLGSQAQGTQGELDTNQRKHPRLVLLLFRTNH